MSRASCSTASNRSSRPMAQSALSGAGPEGEVVLGQPMADVCLVGVGALGGIFAKELASAGLKVVGFERGPTPRLEDYAPRDGIKFLARSDLSDWVKHEPTTVRGKRGEKTPLRRPTRPVNVLGGPLLPWSRPSAPCP